MTFLKFTDEAFRKAADHLIMQGRMAMDYNCKPVFNGRLKAMSPTRAIMPDYYWANAFDLHNPIQGLEVIKDYLSQYAEYLKRRQYTLTGELDPYQYLNVFKNRMQLLVDLENLHAGRYKYNIYLVRDEVPDGLWKYGKFDNDVLLEQLMRIGAIYRCDYGFLADDHLDFMGISNANSV